MFSLLRRAPMRSTLKSIEYSRRVRCRCRNMSSKLPSEQNMVAAGANLPGPHEAHIVKPIKMLPDTEVIDGQSQEVLASTELGQYSAADSKLERHAFDETVSQSQAVSDVNTSPSVNFECEVKTNAEHSRFEKEMDADSSSAAVQEKQRQNTEGTKSDSKPTEQSAGRNFPNIPKGLARHISNAMEWLRVFKVDWDQMQAATAPQPDSPEVDRERVTLKKARELPWSTLWIIVKESAHLYWLTLTNLNEAIRVIEDDDAIMRAIKREEDDRKIEELLREENECSVNDTEYNNVSSKIDDIKVEDIIQRLRDMNPAIFEEARKISDVQGAVNFVKQHKGAGAEQLKAVATDRMQLMGECMGEFMSGYREGKEAGYRASSADENYVENIVTPIYKKFTEKQVDDVVVKEKADENIEKMSDDKPILKENTDGDVNTSSEDKLNTIDKADLTEEQKEELKTKEIDDVLEKYRSKAVNFFTEFSSDFDKKEILKKVENIVKIDGDGKVEISNDKKEGNASTDTGSDSNGENALKGDRLTSFIFDDYGTENTNSNKIMTEEEKVANEKKVVESKIMDDLVEKWSSKTVDFFSELSSDKIFIKPDETKSTKIKENESENQKSNDVNSSFSDNDFKTENENAKKIQISGEENKIKGESNKITESEYGGLTEKENKQYEEDLTKMKDIVGRVQNYFSSFASQPKSENELGDIDKRTMTSNAEIKIDEKNTEIVEEKEIEKEKETGFFSKLLSIEKDDSLLSEKEKEARRIIRLHEKMKIDKDEAEIDSLLESIKSRIFGPTAKKDENASKLSIELAKMKKKSMFNFLGADSDDKSGISEADNQVLLEVERKKQEQRDEDDYRERKLQMLYLKKSLREKMKNKDNE